VQWVAPQLGQRCAPQLQSLVTPQAGRHFSLAARHQHHGPGLLLKAEGNGVIGRGIAGMQGSDHINLGGQLGRIHRLGHR
jgi:hypothetical protein